MEPNSTHPIFEVSDFQLELREGEKVVLVGCAAPYNKLSVPMGKFVERFETRALYPASHGVVALYQHDKGKVLGRTSNDTLRLDFREDGLFFELDLPMTTLGRDVAQEVKRKDVQGVSPGMKVEKNTWDFPVGKLATRSVQKACVFEISVTPFPAYLDTDIALRDVEYSRAMKEFEASNAPQTFPLPSGIEMSKLANIILQSRFG